MNKNFEKKVIWLLFILLIVIGLNGCTYTIKPKISQPDPVVKKEKDVPAIFKMESIANALGCVFAPESCKNKDDEIEIPD
tara:strand:- start:189 stop:428 length:240 start_codon:yes stop_codon:yes gene_type:complete